MSDEKWLTVSEIQQQFNIPQPTTRRYIDRHSHHLFIRKHHKSYLIAEKSIEFLLLIRDLYSKGMNAEQVENALIAKNAPTIIDVIDVSDRVSEGALEVLSRLQTSMIEQYDRQENFNRQLIEAMQLEREDNQRQREIDRKQIERLAEELANVRGEAAFISEDLREEIRKGKQETSEQLSEILSRVDTYGKNPRGLFRWFGPRARR